MVGHIEGGSTAALPLATVATAAVLSKAGTSCQAAKNPVKTRNTSTPAFPKMARRNPATRFKSCERARAGGDFFWKSVNQANSNVHDYTAKWTHLVPLINVQQGAPVEQAVEADDCKACNDPQAFQCRKVIGSIGL